MELKEMHNLLSNEHVDFLGNRYLAIHDLYEALPKKNKDKFAPAIDKLRGRIETQLVAEKKIEELLVKVKKGNMKHKKKCYEGIHENLKVLPRKVQIHYYPQLVHLRHKLESGQ